MKVRDEYDYLIHLIKCAIRNEQPEEVPEGLYFERVYKYAMAHDVANIAFYSVEKLQNRPSAELYGKWQNRRDLAVTRDINQDFAAEEIRTALSGNGIRWLEVQGTRMKKLYPAPEYRTMSDIDFIVDTENLEKSKSLLESLGYECKLPSDYDVEAFRAPNINIELHTAFFADDSEFAGVMDPPFDRAVKKNDGTYEAEITEFYLYSILHLAKHYFRGGCGIRRILDVYMLDEFYRDIADCDYLAECYKKAGISGFTDDIRALAKYWFGDGPEPENSAEMKKYITDSNVHGVLEHRVQNSLGDGSKFRYLWKRLFQDKEYIYRRYPFIGRCKILLPLGWIMRLFYGLTHIKETRLVDEIKIVKSIEQKRGK